MALKDIPTDFRLDSEEEVRFAIAKYFNELGFHLDELSFEDHFTIQLGRTRFTAENGYRKGKSDIKRAEGYSDLLLLREGQPLAIVEVKHFGHDLNDNDAWQAISYARLLRRRIAPYAIVTNGKDTKVYDPLADSDELIEISNPTEAMWDINGQSMPTIGEDLRYEAARKLVGLNAHTLHSFCKNQVNGNLEELEGTIYENKIYVPELYLPRQQLENEFSAWMVSDLPCFAVIGESGVGKSNFMCAKAREQAGHHFVLFYSAQYLSGGLRAALENDFLWEFKRQSNIAQIVDRLDDIVSKHDKQLIIFIDALDEYIGNQDDLKAELREFAHRFSGNSVRLCVSCKIYDWEQYVIDHGQSYNRFAKTIFPKRQPVHDPQTSEDPNSWNVGVWLENFSSPELDDAFEKYSKTFSLQGKLEDETRSECEMPLMLRLVAEVFTEQSNLPSKISSKKLFDKYWERKLGRVSSRVSSELILSTLAKLQVEKNARQIPVGILGQEIGIHQLDEKAYQELVRSGLLRQYKDNKGVRKLSFGFEKLRSYAYTTISQTWTSKSNPEIAREICELLSKPNQLIIEAIDFYLMVIDQGESGLLTEVALTNLEIFIGILNVDHGSSPLDITVQSSDDQEQSHKLVERLARYAEAYSKISRHYFPNLCPKIVPYTKDPVGVWVSEGSVKYQFRSITTEYPQRVVVVHPDITAGLLLGSIHPQFERELGNPAGVIQVGMPDLIRQLPQKVAWERLVEQIAMLFGKGALDESSTPDILQERIQELLFYKPNIWSEDGNKADMNYQKLGFKMEESVYDASTDELYQRANLPLDKHYQELQRLSTEDPTLIMRSPKKRWHNDRIGFLLLLQYYLKALATYRDQLEAPVFSRQEIFECIRNPEAAVPIFDKLTTKIIDAYRQMVE